jgi:tetratricopeptide (TPR) repeat protein
LASVLEALSSLVRQSEGFALSQATQQALTAELGENDPKVLTQLSNQASLHEELGELDQAETLYLRCLAGREEALGADHADTLTTAYNLAFVLSQQDRRAEAIPLRRRELTWCRQQNGNTDPGTLTSINDLAIDLVVHGVDYLLGLSTFDPEAFAARDAAWAAGDEARFWELNDLLQYLGQFAFRAPVPAYRHDAQTYLHLRGLLDSDATHPRSPSRPGSDRDVLADIAARMDGLLERG